MYARAMDRARKLAVTAVSAVLRKLEERRPRNTERGELSRNCFAFRAPLSVNRQKRLTLKDGERSIISDTYP